MHPWNKTTSMKKYLFAAVPLLLSLLAFAGLISRPGSERQPVIIPQEKNLLPAKTPKIQVAILLDVSNSMDGLIEQAKAQLWNMATVLGRTRCGNDVAPKIEIALYEYGRPSNDVKSGFVKQLSGFTSDLDQLSKTLFALKTFGGDEYCGQVMYTSLTDLNWDTANTNYKVIFIAGNEDFLQGRVSFTTACAAAKKKGVLVNTIYCGNRMDGIREHWNLTGECGTGSFTNINQDAAIDDIPTPYDSTLFSLNESLNRTYIAYGKEGEKNYEVQADVDKMNYSMNKSVAAKRVAVKGKKELYNNNHWDLVDASAADKSFLEKVEMKSLPDSLQKKTRTEIKTIVANKNRERDLIQQQIAETSVKREGYLKAQKQKNAAGANAAVTLESEIENILRKQAKQFNMTIQ